MQPKSYYEQQRDEFQDQQKKRLVMSIFTKVAVATVALATVIVVSTFLIGRRPKVDFLDIYYTKSGSQESLRYDANFEIMIEEEHGSLKPESLIITLDSQEEHYEIVGQVGKNSNEFSNLIPNREYKLRVKGNWGYGLGTIREKIIKLNQDATAKITEVSQTALSVSYSFYVIDTFEKLDNSNITVNVYEQNNLVETIDYNLANFSERIIRLTNQHLISKDTYEVKVDILNDNIKLATHTHKVEKELSVLLTHYNFYGEGGDINLSYSLQIIDSFNMIKDEVVHIKLKSNAQTYTYKETIGDLGSGVYELSGNETINRFGEYKMEVRVMKGDTLTLIATFDLVAIPKFEIVNVRDEDGLLFDLESMSNLSITIKNKMKLEAKLYDFRSHGTDQEALAIKKIDPHNLKNIYFKEVEPQKEYLVEVIATLYGKSEVVATHYNIPTDDYLFFNTIEHSFNDNGIDFIISFISNLNNNKITNYRLVISGIDQTSNKTEIQVLENFQLDTPLSYRYDLIDNVHQSLEFKLFTTIDSAEQEVDTRLVYVPTFRAEITEVTASKRNLHVFYSTSDVEPLIENLRIILVDSNNNIVGKFDLTTPSPDVSFTPPSDGSYTIEIRSTYDAKEVLWASYVTQFTIELFGEITKFNYNKATAEFEVTVDSNLEDDGTSLYVVVRSIQGGDTFTVLEIPFDNKNQKITKTSQGFINFFKDHSDNDATYEITLVRQSQTAGDTIIGTPESLTIKKPSIYSFTSRHFAGGPVSATAEEVTFNSDLVNVQDKNILYELYVDGQMVSSQTLQEPDYQMIEFDYQSLTSDSVVIIKAYYIDLATNERIYIQEVVSTYEA